MECGNNICSVIYVKNVYITHCHMVECIEFICSTYMCIHLPYKSLKYYMVYMSNMVGTFVSSTYLAITGQLFITIGCVLPHVQK